jgi:hypothetical protein
MSSSLKLALVRLMSSPWRARISLKLISLLEDNDE